MYPQISKTELFILVTAILFEYKVENEPRVTSGHESKIFCPKISFSVFLLVFLAFHLHNIGYPGVLGA